LNRPLSAQYTKLACDGGVGASCFDLAVLYEGGQVFPRDPVKALALYEKACTAKHQPACAKVRRQKQ
jgi:TPR repeat protein